eukprot:2187742-Amphidinium_carterae.1
MRIQEPMPKVDRQYSGPPFGPRPSKPRSNAHNQGSEDRASSGCPGSKTMQNRCKCSPMTEASPSSMHDHSSVHHAFKIFGRPKDSNAE